MTFIAAMKRNEKVLPYLDLPIQHCNDVILKNMNRRSNRAELLEVIGKLRREIPGITLRTTLIAGFPGETEEQFEDLCNFVKEVRFDRLGCFAYSAEENTVAARMDEPDRAGGQGAPGRAGHADPDRHHGPEAGRESGPDRPCPL